MPRPELIAITADEVTLAGELLLPDDPPPTDRRDRYPWVLLLGSWLARDRDGAFDDTRHSDWFAHGPMASSRPGVLLRLATALAEHGVASIRYDARGCGESGGDWPATGLFTRIDDARDAIGAMRSRRDLDLARTGILGHGEGATIAISVAVGDPAIGALTLVGAPARGFRDLLRRGAATRERTGTDHQHRLVTAIDRWSEEIIERTDRHEAAMRLPLGSGSSVPLTLSAWHQAFHTPTLALATMLHRSVTLVHGADDAWCHPDEAELLRTALPGRADLRLLAGCGHDLAESGNEAIAEIADDLAARLLPQAIPPVLMALEELS